MTDADTMRSTTPYEAGMAASHLGFAQPVPDSGYRWWYVDGFSECGRFGVTVIAFIGSVFSPYYFRARQRGHGSPMNHVSLNVILYGPEKSRWCMTERGAAALTQQSDRLVIGPSDITITEKGLSIAVQERATPWGQRVSGVISVGFERTVQTCFQLDDAQCHWWWPIAPLASIQVAMEQPALSWQGTAYVDSNFGVAPIENGFTSWNWCRGHTPEGHCEIHYDAQLRSGEDKRVSLLIDETGDVQRTDSPALQQLKKGPIWRIARPARLPVSTQASLKTLEDTPFYTRSQLRVSDRQFMHESLDLTRFCQPWVQWLLPFRMPRRGTARSS